MGRNEILEQFWDSKELNEAFRKMHPKELQEDLKSEVFLILAELPEQKLIELYEKKYLRFYTVRIMLNILNNPKSSFFKNHRNFVELSAKEIIEIEQNDITEKVNQSMEELYWYDAEVLRRYAEEHRKNARSLSRSTGIPYQSIIRTLKETKEQLKSKIRKHD